MRWSFAILLLVLPAGPAPAQNQPRARPAAPPADTMAEPGRPGWMVDARNGCWVWNPNPQPGETVSWSGACPRGPAQGQGQGEWRYTLGGQPRVERFSGTLREGRKEGRGTVTSANGDRYEGEYRDGRRHGRGTLTDANGRYEGEWRDGLQHGRGTATWANGARYEGEWRDGWQNGRGTYTFADGGRYEGEWRDDRPDGYGEYYDAKSGTWSRGQWTRGCYRGADGRRSAIGRPLSECP